MAINRVAFHLRTGSVAAGNLIRAWLHAHAYAVSDAPDPYSAVAFFRSAPDFAPSLVLIGAPGLAPGEERVIDYASQRWPDAWIIVYDDLGDIEHAAASRVRFVGPATSATFRAMIAQPPVAYLVGSDPHEPRATLARWDRTKAISSTSTP